MSERHDADSEAHNLKLGYLQASELFQDFSPGDFASFHDTIQMRTCRAGHVFYRPGETGEVMFLLKQGAAQLYRMSTDGRKYVFAQLVPGSVFGEMSCIGQGMHDCFAEATADSVLCTLSRTDVGRLITSHPPFAIRLLEALGRRMLQTERQLEDVAFKAVVPRLATLLLTESRDDVLEGFSHQQIGERLGVYRETATYALNELKAAGIVEIGRRRIRIIDRDRLRQTEHVR